MCITSSTEKSVDSASSFAKSKRYRSDTDQSGIDREPIHTSQKYVSIPMDIFQKVEKPIEAIVWGYIEGWENALRRSKVYMDAGVARMAVELGVSEDTISRSIKNLVQLGLIFTQRTPRGSWYSTKVDVICDPANCGITKKVIPQIAVSKCKPQIAVSNKGNPLQVTQSNPVGEPTASDPSVVGRLPNPLLHKPRFTMPKQHGLLLLNHTQVDLASQYMGATGEDNKAPSLFSSEQFSRDGFIESVLRKCIDASAKKPVLSRVGLLCKIRDESWNGGRWIDTGKTDLAFRELQVSKRESARAKMAALLCGANSDPS
jgi:hypothetical protein